MGELYVAPMNLGVGHGNTDDSASFNQFRGTDWMPLPCRECPQREIDFGGCRCQAALIAGDANVTDPACSLSPYRGKLTSFVESIQKLPATERSFAAEIGQLSFRQAPVQTEIHK